MRGVILAGGLGSRLLPLTKVTNKHLLPVGNKPMIYYPLASLKSMDIRDVLIVTGGNSAGDFLKLLGNGSEFGMNFYYAYQEGEGGIADALRLAEGFVSDHFVVMLGDNIITTSLNDFAWEFRRQGGGARVLLKQVPNPHRFGVANMLNGRIVEIVEKPASPKSNYAVTGVYAYTSDVFDFIRTMKPSERGELEITDVNNFYLRRNLLRHTVLQGFWSDAGTFESLATSSEHVWSQANNPS